MTGGPDLLPADDRGLGYGDGLFETLRFTGGRAPLAPRHCRRMAAGARRLGIPFDEDAWWRALDAAVAGGGEGVAKLILTRGSGGRGYRPPARPRPRLLWQRHPLVARPARQYRDGLVLGVAATRLSDQPALAGLKHLNRLEQVLAAGETARQGWDEALMLDRQGRPMSLTSMNLFAVCDGELRTPPLARAGVHGVMRGLILDDLASAQGLMVRQRPLTLAHMRQAEEVFACNSVAGIMPVRKLGLWNWSAGPVTAALATAVGRLFES